MESIKLIAGLGNPGRHYMNTRHNAGFEVLDLIGVKYDIGIDRARFNALLGNGIIDGTRVLLAKPQTYMNRSGESVREIAEWYKITVNNIIVVYDDIDIPLGKLRIRPRGSAGTHNGMRSVIYSLQDDGFPRVRIGIGRPQDEAGLVSYVLGKYDSRERLVIDRVVVTASEAAVCAAAEGIDTAMNRYNGAVNGDEDEIFYPHTEGD